MPSRGEAVGVAHDRGLRSDRIADGHDGLVPCRGELLQVTAEKLRIDGARGSVRQEVLLQVGDPLGSRRSSMTHGR